MKISSVWMLVIAFFSAGCTARAPEQRTPGAQAPHFGDVMTEVGHRFEMIGKAEQANRWDLAHYELGELVEAFGELPRAAAPEGTDDTTLRQIEQAFLTTDPPLLGAAIRARDTARFAEAFSRTAATCNGCHIANHREFIEVPATPGAAVPKLDPVR